VFRLTKCYLSYIDIRYNWSILVMQLQTKPKYYADVNKHMDESYYNYEAYEI